MGHVIDSEKCEQCGRARYISYNYKTQEEYDTCTVCEKTYKLFIKRDEEGNIVYDKNNNPIFEEIKHNGFGTAILESKEGAGTLYVFDGPISEEVINKFLEAIKESSKERSRLTKWDPDKKELVALFGEIPGEFSEKLPETGTE